MHFRPETTFHDNGDVKYITICLDPNLDFHFVIYEGPKDYENQNIFEFIEIQEEIHKLMRVGHENWFRVIGVGPGFPKRYIFTDRSNALPFCGSFLLFMFYVCHAFQPCGYLLGKV